MKSFTPQFASAIALCMWAGSAIAQSVEGSAELQDTKARDMEAAAPSEDSVARLEIVTVTAQRREQSLQDVPVTVSAVTADTLEKQGISDTASLANTIVGLNFNNTAGAGVPVIRGIGSTNVVLGDESSVATYVDGVYRPFRAGNIFSFNNIERVEVLKGPQGALFGRNSTGGVVQVITNNPSDELTFRANLGYATYDTTTGSLYVSGGLTDKLAADFAVYSRKQSKGWGDNLGTGGDAYLGDETSLRSKLRWEPTDRTSVTFAGEYSEYKDSIPYRLTGNSVGLDGQPAPSDFYNVTTTYAPEMQIDQSAFSATIEHELVWANFKSITSYQTYNGLNTPDNDVTTLPILNAYLASTGEAVTQEFQLFSPDSSAVDWIIGGFYMNADAGNESVRLSGLAFAGSGIDFSDTRAIQTTNSYSAFGQVGVPLGEKWKVTGGLRYTSDEQELDFVLDSNLGLLGSGTRSKTFENISPRIVLEYTPTEDILLFASYNGGFKSGLFNTVEPTRPVVRPEELQAYELGMKSTLFDRRMIFNGAAYFYDYEDLQVLQVVAASTVLLNAATVEIYGLDADVEFAVTDKLVLRGGLSLIEGEYSSFGSAPTSVSNMPSPGNTILPGDAAGNQTARTPEYQLIVGGTYDFSDQLSFSVNLNHTDSYAWEADNRLEEPSHDILNATLNWTSPDSRYGVSVWGKNLLDEEVNVFATALPFGDIAQAGAPLTAGITLKYNYN